MIGLLKKSRIHAAIMAIFIAAFATYFALFLFNSYSTFHMYSDLGGFAYNMYFNLHYPQIAHGFQYLAFDVLSFCGFMSMKSVPSSEAPLPMFKTRIFITIR